MKYAFEELVWTRPNIKIIIFAYIIRNHVFYAYNEFIVVGLRM
jgi:hypothetical protein